MSLVSIQKKDEVYVKIETEPAVDFELKDFFRFAVPGAQFTPQYRAKLWDGFLNLYNVFSKELYVGLVPYVEKFCEQHGYAFENLCPTVATDDYTALPDFLAGLNAHSNGSPIEIRDYQIDAVHHALTQGRALLLSPTASGKSLILYALMRWHLQYGRKQLLIVPTTSLVEQMYGDFSDYASATPWKVQQHCTKVYSGTDADHSKAVIIATWQSLHKLPKKYFEQFDVIYGDECHLFKAKSLTSIMHKCTTAKYRVGTTGTLDGSKTHKLVLEGLFGTSYKVTSTKTLMDKQQLASLKIVCLQLEYADEEKKLTRELTYAEELDWLVTHPRRNQFLRNLILDRQQNTLVLFQFVEKHGKVLHQLLEEKLPPERRLFFVHGKVDAESREEVRAITEHEQNAIILASYGVYSTGINIRNLHNIIFASPSKSRIRNLQSIGRGLRISDQKTQCKLYDIGDDLSYKKHKNYTLLHLIERIKLYNEEGFTYNLVRVPFHGH